VTWVTTVLAGKRNLCGNEVYHAMPERLARKVRDVLDARKTLALTQRDRARGTDR